MLDSSPSSAVKLPYEFGQINWWLLTFISSSLNGSPPSQRGLSFLWSTSVPPSLSLDTAPERQAALWPQPSPGSPRPSRMKPPAQGLTASDGARVRPAPGLRTSSPRVFLLVLATSPMNLLVPSPMPGGSAEGTRCPKYYSVTGCKTH